jgi:uncharacterized protein
LEGFWFIFMKKVIVAVVPKSTQQKVEWISSSEAKVWVHAAPEKGKANAEVCELLAKELGLKKRQVNISAGESSKKKIVAISPPFEGGD